MKEPLAGSRIAVSGVVQGVGFRPFVYRLAQQHGLVGWVCNTSAGVALEVNGGPEQLSAFVQALTAEAPPLARIEAVQVEPCPPNGYAAFEIRGSQAEPGEYQPVSPDISICPDCLRELFDPADRRYRYPFINCTNCGPRFTIIRDMPYDRPQTTMASFGLCPDCAREYHDPADRRFHAQPVACPVCGPQVWLEGSLQSSVISHQSSVVSDQLSVISDQLSGVSRQSSPATRHAPPVARGDAAIREARCRLAEGQIVAVKGLGGFHLACDAANDEAVLRLRQRKGRAAKPFALMAPDLAAVERICRPSPQERALLESRERPIVLLPARAGSAVSPHVAPGQNTLGVMLPYTPLHYLLFAPEPEAGGPGPFTALVMTSGNYAEEPILTDNLEALARLGPLADAFLLHDRDIHVRADDSVVRVQFPLRRSRGYAPLPVRLPFESPPLLAVGGELKNALCLARGRQAFLSHHIGDLENLEALESFEAAAAHFERLFRVQPQLIAHDLHPDYRSTRYAVARAQPLAVQHHHAHVAACMAENGLDGTQPVIGVAFDGTGYGPDGAIWGGEFLIADYAGYKRAAHLAYVPLPGGDAATRRPARTALAYLLRSGVPLADSPALPPLAALPAIERRVIERQIALGLNAPLTSSMGRLFDAVAALLGVRQEVDYEGQAAIELEALADPAEAGAYAFELTGDAILPWGVIRGVVGDVCAGLAPEIIAARFHNAVAQMILEVCLRLRPRHGLNRVALSGGVFQNVTLLNRVAPLLGEAGFEVLLHRLVPPNDGGLALGQAAVAACAKT